MTCNFRKQEKVYVRFDPWFLLKFGSTKQQDVRYLMPGPNSNHNDDIKRKKCFNGKVALYLLMAQCALAVAFHENRRQQVINQHKAISCWCGNVHDIRKVSVQTLDHDYNVNLVNKNYWCKIK